LSAAAVALMQSRNSFEANTKLIKVADQMDQALLDMIG
jgi:flagellar hook protein FlgE